MNIQEQNGIGEIGSMQKPLGERIREPLSRVHIEGGSILLSTVAMSAACLGVVSIAGAVRRGSPWVGINAIAAGLGITDRRPSPRFGPLVSLASLGTIVGGSVVLALLADQVAPRIRGGRIGRRVARGLIASLGGVVLDKLFMRDKIFGAFDHALGVPGTVAKYSAMGIAAAIASR